MSAKGGRRTQGGKRSKTQKEKHSRERKRRNKIELFDGSLATCKTRAKPRRRESDEDVLAIYEKVRKITANPHNYRHLDFMVAAEKYNDGPGRTYPWELLSVLLTLRAVFRHIRELEREIVRTPCYLKMVWEGVLRNAKTWERQEIRELIGAGRFPDRSTMSRIFDAVGCYQEILDRVQERGIDVALEGGHFDLNRENRASDPDARDCLVTDGTVHSLPTKNDTELGFDPVTGETYPLRTDPSRGRFHEGGQAETLPGAKTVTIWTTFPGQYNWQIPLGVAICKKPDPSSEADIAVDLTLKIEADLERRDGTGPRRHHVTALVGDGAASAKHARDLAAAGILLHNPPPAKSTDVDSDTGKKIRVSEHEYYLTRIDCACGGHDVVIRGGDPYEKEIADGGVVWTLLHPAPRFVRRADGGLPYTYFTVKVHCEATNVTHFVERPLTRDKGETADQYVARLGKMRAWGRTSPNATRLKGLTNTVEGFHSMTDGEWRGGRIPVYVDPAKIALLAGILLGKISLVSDLIQRAQSPPGG